MATRPTPNRAHLELERARLALDRDRLDFEKRKFDQQDFVERWRVDTQPVHEHRLLSREQAHSFSKVAIQMLFLLNGGALVAPGFAQFVRGQIDLAQLEIAPFIFGLVCITITATLAYVSMDLDAGAVSDKETSVRIRLLRSRTPPNQLAALDEDHSASERFRRNNYRAAIACSLVALLFGMLSLGAFIYGAVKASDTLKASSANRPAIIQPPPVPTRGYLPIQ